jgi:hypothetical protein
MVFINSGIKKSSKDNNKPRMCSRIIHSVSFI